MAVVKEDETHVVRAGFVARNHLEQSRIAVRCAGAGVGVVAALFTFDIDSDVAHSSRCFVVLALHSYVRGLGFKQCAVYTEVFIAGETGPASRVLDANEEHAGQTFGEELLAVGAEGGVVPDLDVQVRTSSTAGFCQWSPSAAGLRTALRTAPKDDRCRDTTARTTPSWWQAIRQPPSAVRAAGVYLVPIL